MRQKEIENVVWRERDHWTVYVIAQAITVKEVSTVRGASCSAPGQSRVPWALPSQLPAYERKGFQVSAPRKQLLTKAAAIVIPGAQGPSQPSSKAQQFSMWW